MLERKDFSLHVAARLLEFFSARSGWFRGLWEVGISLSLREILEAAEAASVGVLSQAAVEWLAAELQKSVGLDEGLELNTRRVIQRLLDPKLSKLTVGGGELPALRRLADQVEETYLQRWADCLQSGTAVGPERTARAVASHMLDSGLSPDFLHRWWSYHLLHAAETYTLADIVVKAHELVRAPPVDFRVLVPVNSALNLRSHPPPEWRDATAVSTWLSQHRFDPAHVRQGGGWLLTLKARDPHSAVEKAAEAVDRLGARLLIGAGHQLRHGEHAYVEGNAKPIRLRRPRRVEVRSLERQEQLFRHDGPSRVDSAFELLGQLDGPAVVAVAAGWAAIEALLVAPGDGQKSPAADRMASLVACSFPRAELTLLAAVQIYDTSSPLSAVLQACKTNRERATLLAEALKFNQPLVWNEWKHRAAVARMQGLFREPRKTLQDVETYAKRTFRRLYRQRNLVLHGGRTSAVALNATLRTAAPLLGAGIDRIAHAWFVHQVQPLELALTARHRIELLDSKSANGPIELLE